MWGRSPPPTPPARVPSTEGNIQEQSDVLVAESALLSARMIGFSKKQHEERRLICLSGTGILIVAMGNVIDVEHLLAIGRQTYFFTSVSGWQLAIWRRIMFTRSITLFLATLCLSSVAVSAGLAQSHKLKDEAKQSEKAAKVFQEIMDTPDKGIPSELLDNAECVAVFPDVIKAGFIVGGRGGRGVASCRTARGWSAPAFFNLGGGSIGLQIGAQSTDFVLLFMNKQGLNSLLSDKFEIGADASVAAGPVGRQAGASTDVKLDAQILSYSRSKGLFAGVELKGVVINSDKDDMRDVYGEGVTAKAVLQENKVTAPDSVRALPSALGRYSERKAER
jgi:lipid-binding SYLF domain-containing protein